MASEVAYNHTAVLRHFRHDAVYALADMDGRGEHVFIVPRIHLLKHVRNRALSVD